MGLAIESVKDTVNYVIKTKALISIAVIYTLFSASGVLFDGVLKAIHYILLLVIGFVFGTLVLCTFKKPSLPEAFKLVPKYIVKIIILSLIILVIMVAIIILSIIITIITSILDIPAFFVIIPFVVSVTYVSLRLTLSSTIIVLKDANVGDSIKQSWTMSKGKVISIFAASITLSMLIMIPIIIIAIGGVLIKGSMLYANILEILSSFIQSIYLISSYTLSVMLYKNILKQKPPKITTEPENPPKIATEPEKSLTLNSIFYIILGLICAAVIFWLVFSIL